MSRPRAKKPHSTDWQRRVLADLRAAATEKPDAILHLGQWSMTADGNVELSMTLNTSLLGKPAPNGLPVGETEEVDIRIGPSQMAPPRVHVTHSRFMGYPHVLQGFVLCLYLDPSREWDPDHGGVGFLNRLWNWLDDAAAGRFDPSEALYHAVGGVLHAKNDSPTLVIREDLPRRCALVAHLVPRTAHRLDLTLKEPATTAERVPVFQLRHPLPLGAGHSQLTDLLQQIDFTERAAFTLETPDEEDAVGVVMRQPSLSATAIEDMSRACETFSGSARKTWDPTPTLNPPPRVSTALLTTLAAAASRNPEGTEQHLIVAVPHPTGGPDHLLALALPASVSDNLRRLVRDRRTIFNTITTAKVTASVSMRWCPISDERPEVTRRRDHSTPMKAYLGRTVHIWGCGGIGSWMAEYVVRAGAKAVTLCDPGTLSGGLLVRQNYAEDDIGDTKVESLARRLRAIRDDITIQTSDDTLPDELLEATLAADVLIDATISHAIGGVLNILSQVTRRTVTIAQVATDARTGSLGIATIAPPSVTEGIRALDSHAAKQVEADATLENYATFWTEPVAGDEFVPTRGCSQPTFHGSAADMASISATLTTLIGQSLRSGASGTHLVALPHSGVSPAHQFLPFHLDGSAPDSD